MVECATGAAFDTNGLAGGAAPGAGHPALASPGASGGGQPLGTGGVDDTETGAASWLNLTVLWAML